MITHIACPSLAVVLSLCIHLVNCMCVCELYMDIIYMKVLLHAISLNNVLLNNVLLLLLLIFCGWFCMS